MKPSKIYIKIFFSFLLILIVTEILIFALFGIIMGRYFQSEVDHYASAQVMMVKEIIDSKIRTAPDVDLSRNEPLKDFIRNWGEALGAQVWLQGSDGQLVAKSFSGDLPKEQSELQAGQWRDLGAFRMYHGHKKSSRLYAVIPIKVKAGKNAELHVFFAKREPSHPQEGFGLGLVIIGVVIALLVMPVSRLISKPINELRQLGPAHCRRGSVAQGHSEKERRDRQAWTSLQPYGGPVGKNDSRGQRAHCTHLSRTQDAPGADSYRGRDAQGEAGAAELQGSGQIPQ